MSAQTYQAMARKHWAKWLPKKVAELKASEHLEAALQMAGRLAQARVLELMQQGFRATEADEVARSEYIQLKPEPGAGTAQWESKELADLESQYRKMMGSQPSD